MEKKSTLTRITDIICTAETAVATAMFVLMLAMIVIQVFCRYVVHIPLAWAEEFMRFLFITTTFLGAAVCTRTRSHVEINFIGALVKRVVKDRLRTENILNRIDVVVYLTGMTFCGFVTKLLFEYTVKLKAQGQLSSAMEIPLWCVAAFILAGMFMCAVHYVINLIELFLSGPKRKQEDEGTVL
ncbi:MAG: TRAP transporter small permease [Clostridiales Family XIII bacterium]|nr:TRAP transporter small permease [Clostridiales Family XIII bacterium]